MEMQDGILGAMQGMLDLCDSNLGKATSNQASQRNAAASSQAWAAATLDPAAEQSSTESALDAAWEEFKKRVDSPATQVTCISLSAPPPPPRASGV